ncbi:tRNA (adenosine(37)-N6)-threonylcarbamoyltransferase complex ATPase subunit type 1 TsaE [Shimia sp. MMG029]|uniref:tRNA (adenosine(37)-N6)-threonylcarbamoyltransferase complex ATPase subunit type 1 TsaE n=1 Tax=Shimia sp. MMG029 TaxID=3021978 RepID=UPI0022FDF9AD|nr:tRNA (adenosine(37)-N6)-threonylcarbamoyltransferase complex ATPase subunit type 1 TsaE [Shimia sp. MMG029]MDA5557347.1 tRNA (adenosine(37)-N6)-threonylcarbamoyltransferase complex ATPase subunit type 1 TsaE [Shimia sp. MMG029]
MTSFHLSLDLSSANATQDLAIRIGATLQPTDVLLLEGPIGAGKTHFARSLIQSLLPVAEDVPSPTFTLVQVYETAESEIWHTDLYRLTSPDEVVELGLTDAFEEAICLVEWPDRLADLQPDNALFLSFSLGKDEGQRHLRITAKDQKWAPLFESLAQ